VYYQFKDELAIMLGVKPSYLGSNELSYDLFISNFVAASMASCVDIACSYPFKLAHTRVGSDIGAKPEERRFRGSYQVFKEIIMN
jgi:hypothetical protein